MEGRLWEEGGEWARGVLAVTQVLPVTGFGPELQWRKGDEWDCRVWEMFRVMIEALFYQGLLQARPAMCIWELSHILV